MRIYIGADHAGYKLKETIKKRLSDLGNEVIDMGTDSDESTDYPDYAKKVSEAVANDNGSKGVLICGTGIGMSMTANKIKGIRAALCHDEYTARAAREHNDANILCMGARVLDENTAEEISKIFFSTEFSSEERHHRRVNKISEAGSC